MKFRDIYNIIKDIDIKKLDISTSSQQRNGITYQVMYVRKEQKEILQKILEIPYFKDEFADFFNKNFLSTEIEEFTKNETSLYKIRLIKDVIMFYRTCFEKMYPELNEFSISIKIPDEYTLEQIGEYFKDLQNKIYPLLIDKRIEGDFILKNFDTGSKWIDVNLKSIKALGVIIALLSGAMELANKIQDFRLKELEIQERKQKLEEKSEKNESLKKEIEHYEIYLKIEKNFNEERITNKAEEIYKKYFLENLSEKENGDEELKIKINKALKSLTNYVIDGSYIRPAIEYKENFEGVDVQKLLACGETKAIEDKSIKN